MIEMTGHLTPIITGINQVKAAIRSLLITLKLLLNIRSTLNTREHWNTLYESNQPTAIITIFNNMIHHVKA